MSFILVLIAVAVASVGYFHGQAISELLQVGAGFTATAVCFGHFVSHRDVQTVTNNELAGIATILTAFRIDEGSESVIAFPRFLVTAEVALRAGIYATSYYLGGDLGCRLSRERQEMHTVKRSMVHDLVPESSLPLRTSRSVQTLLDFEVSAAAVHTNQTRAMVVIHHGSLVGEAYQSHLGVTRDTPLLGWSMTKSVQAMLVGAAIQRGLFNLSTPAKFVKPSPHRCSKSEQVTIGELLVMSDIIPFEENYAIHSVVPKMLFAAHSAPEFAASVVGSREVSHRAKELYQCSAREDFNSDVHDWYYSSGVTNLLAKELRSYFQSDEEYWRFPREALFEPLGIPAFAMGTDPNGTFIASSFSYGTARSWAKLGQLMIQKGRWGDIQLIPEEFVRWVQVPHPFSGGHYGGSFWLNPSRVNVSTYNYLPSDHPAKQNHFWMTRALPTDAYFMSGFEGQYTIIIPSLDAVIVRLGFTSKTKDQEWDKSALFGGIVSALKQFDKA